MAEESAVKVCVRVRPLVPREESDSSESGSPVQLFWKADKKSIHQVDGNPSKSFSFDRVFTAEESTNQLYQAIAKPLVVSTVEGYNGTIFAYGQTSSGKTFTMMGTKKIPGVMPLAVEDVFQTIKKLPEKEFLLRVSYMEIYNETVTDLLVDSWKRKPLEVREGIDKNIYVADLTEELVTSFPQALAWIRKGEKNRHYGKTKMNQRSSRSHTIFRMILERQERSDPASGENADGAIIVSHLNLVDLAGSERASQTGAEGARLKEGCNINRSLFTLGQVIKKLTDESQKGFTNYRDSKLTRILQNSLGGNAKTLIICTITPVTLDETLSTLQFACTAKKMKNDPHVTEVSDDGALLKRYRNEIVDLKRRLHEVSSVTQTTATEKEVLSQLLQEKDQLQREQEDRIRNLTKLLVTSSNPVPVQKLPKRRVTWGGKMMRLAHPSAFDDGMSGLGFVESFRKRTANSSYLTELAEDDESFDCHWGIPEEPSDDMDMTQNSVTSRNFGDREFGSPDLMCELSEKVSTLEMQLELENQQKEETIGKLATLDGQMKVLQDQLQTEAMQKQEVLENMNITEQRVSELEMQLQTEAQQKHEDFEKIHLEQRVAELEMQLQTEVQQKQEDFEKIQLEQKVAELEMQLQTEAQQKHEDFEKIHLEQRVAELEMQLQTEAQQKQEDFEKIHLEQKVAELEMQLQTEAQQKQEDFEKIQLEQKVAELEMQLQTEAQQKQEDFEKIHLEQRVAELEMQLQTEAQQKQEMLLQTEAQQKQEDFEKIQLEQRVSELEMQLQTEAQQKHEDFEKIHLEQRVAELEMQLQTEVQQKQEDFEKIQLEQKVAELEMQLQTEAQQKHEDFEKIQLEQKVAELEIQLQTEAQQKQEDFEKIHLEQRVAELEMQLQTEAQQKQEDFEKIHLEQKVAELEMQLQTEAQQKHEDFEKIHLEQRVAELEMQLQTEAQQKQEDFEKIQLEQKVAELEMQLQTEAQQKQEMQLQTEAQQKHEDFEKIHLEQRVAELEMQLQTEAQQKQEMQLQTEAQQKHEDFEKIHLEQRVAELEMQLQTEAQQKQEDFEKIQLEQKVAELEMQLQTEAQQKQEMQLQTEAQQKHEDFEKIHLEQRVAELEMQLQTEAQQKHEDFEKIHLEQRVAELEIQLKTEAQQKQDSMERLEFEMADLQRAPEEQMHIETEKMRKEFAEAIQLCETLASEKDTLAAERDYLKQELGMFIEHTENLEKEKATLSQELKERRDLDEFKSLEDEFRKEHEMELQNEISSLKEAIRSSELHCLDLQNNLEVLSAELTKKTEFAAELQSMSGKDLVEEVSALRRSLNDAEGLSRDTKKEWALLRSQNIALEELNVTLTATNDQMSAEVNSLSFQLETEKAQNKKMQSDLQKELNIAFKENAKLNTLLEGKVPQDVKDCVELERTVTRMSKELKASHEAQEGLRAQLKEIASIQTTPDSTTLDQLADLTKRVGSSSLEKELSQQCADELHIELEHSDQDQSQLEDKHVEMPPSQGLQRVQHEEKEMACVQECSKEVERLLSTVASLTAERDQLKADLQENVDMMIENQEELRTALERNRSQMRQIKLLESAQFNLDGSPNDFPSQLEALKAKIQTLTQELESVRAERDRLLSERGADTLPSAQEMEKLLLRVSSLSEERDQLNRMLEELRRDKTQLREDMEDRTKALQTENVMVAEKETSTPPSEQMEEMEKLLLRVSSLSEERDQLNRMLEELRRDKTQLRDDMEDRTKALQTENVMVAEKETSTPPSEQMEEMEKLLLRVSSLSEERDQLNGMLEELRRDKTQLREDMEDRTKMMEQLQTTLQAFTKEKNKTEDELQHSREMAAETQKCLDSLQEQLTQQNQRHVEKEKTSKEERAVLQRQLAEANRLLQALEEDLQHQKLTHSNLVKLYEQKESDVEQQIQILSEKLANSQAESLEMGALHQHFSEEEEKLLCKVRSLTEERDELQEALNLLREEKAAPIAELEKRMEMIQQLETHLNKLKEELKENRKELTILQEKNQVLQEEVTMLRSQKAESEGTQSGGNNAGIAIQQQSHQMFDQEFESASANPQTKEVELEKLPCSTSITEEREDENKREMLNNEAIQTISALKEELNSFKLRTKASLQFPNSTGYLQEFFGKLEQFKDICSKCQSRFPHKTLLLQSFVTDSYLTALPEPTMNAYDAVFHFGQLPLEKEKFVAIPSQLYMRAHEYRRMFEALLNTALFTTGEKWLQDLLLCRTKDPHLSVKDEHSLTLWGLRQKELQEKQQLYLQKMDSILEKLAITMASFLTELKDEILEKEKLEVEVQSLISNQPNNFSRLDGVLKQELERRSVVAQRRMELLQFVDEQNILFQELQQLDTQDYAQLREERSESLSLLEAVSGDPLQKELSLPDHKLLVLQLQQAEENNQSLRARIKWLEEVEKSASDRLSSHKRATQLLQTELQDSRTHVEEKENTIQSLKRKLQQSEQKTAGAAPLELEKLQNKLFKMELTLTSVSDDHQQEIQRMAKLLGEKEESLRKLKEALRRSQQQGDESILQGEELCSRLTKPRGVVTQSSILLEKTKLEEDVKQLQLKISELESLTFSQQAEISKWKNRAISLRMKSKAGGDKPSSPCTPTKRSLPMTSEPSHLLSSPRKFLFAPGRITEPNSPKLSLLDSPKSRFFDACESSELLSRTCPKQFFDNSSLGTIPEAAVGPDKNVEWWPSSPKQEEMCKTQ
ncbi:centromere-associated protein E isoform 2-T2 [Menidia menidia]